MAYNNIVARLLSDVSGVSGIGKAYELKKHIHDEHEKNRLLKASGGQLHAWFIYREGFDEPTDYNTLVLDKYNFVIEGWYALNSGTDTEKTFATLVNDVISAVNADRLLGGYGYVYRPAYAVFEGEEMFVDVLCNHIKITVPILLPKESGAKDMVYVGTSALLASAARTSSSYSSSANIEKYWEGAFYINVTAIAGTGTQLIIHAEKSSDDSTFAKFQTFDPQITATGLYIMQLSNFGKYVRVNYEIIGGTAKSVTFTVTFEGKNPYGI